MGYGAVGKFEVCSLNSNVALDGDNQGYARGGALYSAYNTRVNMTASHIFDNLAEHYGGGIYFDSVTSGFFDACNIHSNQIENSASGYGAGLCVSFTNAVLTSCTITSNSGGTRGGAGVFFACTVKLRKCAITSNSCSSYGGALFLADTTATFQSTTFESNSVTSYGGCIYSASAPVKLVHCVFTSNVATHSGGVLYVASGMPEFRACTFTSNRAGEAGGAVAGADVKMVNVTFVANSAPQGGALSLSGSCTGCKFEANIADNGGAVYSTGSILLPESVFTSCRAEKGAALYSTSSVIMTDAIVENFNASSGDQLFYHTSGSEALALELDRVAFVNNKLPAVHSEDEANVIIRNCEGLASSDADTSDLIVCDNENIGTYCPYAYCTNAIVGIEVRPRLCPGVSL